MSRHFHIANNVRMAVAVFGLFAAASAFATPVPYYYTDWLTANPSGGTAHGLITLPDSSTATVDFKATNADGTAGNFLGAYLNDDATHWDYTSDYTSAEVANPPSPKDMLQLVGGENETYTLTFGAPIKGPLMDVVSLGNPSQTIQYDFNSPFVILSQGPDDWGPGCNACLSQSGNDLIGAEGSGAIKFTGTYSTFSWTVPVPEDWHGFTFGIRTTEALEPNPPSNMNVPEPPAAALFGMGLLGIRFMLVMKRRKCKANAE